MMRGQKGFTLMETLLAITLFMLVIVSSYGVFSMGIQIWKRVTGVSPAQRNALFTLEKMGEDIRSAIVLPKPDTAFTIEKKEKKFELGGSEEAFMLPLMLPGKDSGGEGRSYLSGAAGYKWNSSKGQLCRMTQNVSQLYEEKEPVCRVMLANVRKLKFQYWISSPISQSYSWYDSWDADEGLPQAIRAQIEVAVRNKKNSPVMKFERTFWVPVADPPIVVETGGKS